MDNDPIIGWLVAYKAMAIAAGCFFCLIGYRLFKNGFVSGESGLSLGYRHWNLSLTRVAPGILFLLAGAMIVGMSVFKGIDVHDRQTVPARAGMGDPGLPPQVDFGGSTIESEPVPDSSASPSAETDSGQGQENSGGLSPNVNFDR